MSYTGGRLAPWFDTGPNDRFCRRLARRGGDRMTELTRENTPVDTGALRQSIKQKPVVKVLNQWGDSVWSSGCETDLDYGPPIEHGWGLWGPKHAKYPITPKTPGGWLHWVDPHTGEDRFAKLVMHPGAPGAHMFAIAAGLTEAQLGTIAEPELARWAKEVERQNRSGEGVTVWRRRP